MEPFTLFRGPGGHARAPANAVCCNTTISRHEALAFAIFAVKAFTAQTLFGRLVVVWFFCLAVCFVRGFVLGVWFFWGMGADGGLCPHSYLHTVLALPKDELPPLHGLFFRDICDHQA